MNETEYVIIIGAMKSGTTSLYEYLSDHPEVCTPIVKEPEYFSENGKRRVDVEEYKSLWKNCEKRGKYKLEASTRYTKYPFETGVPERIYKYGIRPKFIYIVRNPIDRIESHYNHIKINKKSEIKNFEDQRLIEVSKYHKQLKEFTKVFKDRERYLILDFDEIKNKPKYTIKNCIKFIGAKKSWEFKKKKPQNKTPERKIELWIREISTLKNAVGRRMTEEQRRVIKQILGWFTPPVDRRKMSSSERSMVRERLRTDMQRFEKEFGFDVGKWGF